MDIVRNIFINFFKSKNYKFISNSNLIPLNDNSLLFTNSGMVQFKSIFLGYKNSIYNRIITIQPSVRISGKHNDLSQIGLKHNHHTFFEMLGNFSFNYSSKKFTIIYNWDLLVKFYKFPINKLFVTVYEDDIESYLIWLNIIKLSSEKLIKVGYNNFNVSDNFWEVSDIGLCGPSTEIFYNYKENLRFFLKKKNKYLELCNIVFIQYNKNNLGNFDSLLNLFIDTGLGLERLTSIIQNIKSNYRIKYFKKFILLISKQIKFFNLEHNFLKIIFDHIRTCIFLINDGVIISNFGRGYILKHIIRRILNKNFILRFKKGFFINLILFLIKNENFYFNLKFNIFYIIKIFILEEKIFLNLMFKKIFFFKKKLIINNILKNLEIYDLYNTYGFSMNVITNLFKYFNINIYKTEIYFYLNYQVFLKKKKNKIKKKNFLKNLFKNLNFKKKDIFKVICIYINKFYRNFLLKKNKAILILNKTLFFSSGGGQSSDIGTISNNNFFFIVFDSINIIYNFIGHIGFLKFGIVKLNDIVTINIDFSNRFFISCNHSALHILIKSIKNILNNILNINSFVNSRKIKISFNLNKRISNYDISMIEIFVNKEIFYNFTKSEKYLYKKNFKDLYSIFFKKNIKFKYLTKIRLIKVGSSLDFCKGTHVNKTGFIGFFKILNFKHLNLNLIKIEALSNINAIINLQDLNLNFNLINNLFNVNKLSLCNIDSFLFNYRNIRNFNINLKNNFNLFFELKIFKNLFFFKKNIFLRSIFYNIKNSFFKKINIKKFIKDIFMLFIFNNIFNIINIIISTNNNIKIKPNYILFIFLKNFNGIGFGNLYYSYFYLKKNYIIYFFFNFLDNYINKINFT